MLPDHPILLTMHDVDRCGLDELGVACAVVLLEDALPLLEQTQRSHVLR